MTTIDQQNLEENFNPASPTESNISSSSYSQSTYGDKTSTNQDPSKRTIFKIPVKEGVTYANILSIPLITCANMLLLTFFNAQIVFLLTDPKMFDVPTDQIGYVTGMLSFLSQPFAIFSSILAGYLYDLFGRRITITVSLVIGSILTAAVPWTSPYLVPWLFVVKVCCAFFITIPVCNPLCADYIQKQAIGRGSSIQGFGMIIGEVLSMAVLFRVTANMNEKESFAVAGASGLAFAVLIALMVTEKDKLGKSFQTEQQPVDWLTNQRVGLNQELEQEVQQQDGEFDEEAFKRLPICKKAKVLTQEVLKACQENKTIPLMFIGCMIAKLYAILFSTFWLLFVTSFIGTSKVENEDQAKLIYSNLMVVSVVLGIIVVPVFGKIIDSFNPQFVIPAAFFTRAIGVGLFMFCHDPSSWYSYIVSVAMVLGTMFEGLCTESLLLRNASPRTRGLIFSTGHAFGSIGLLIFALVGGILFDRYGPYMPFVFVGLTDCFFALLCIVFACSGTIKNDIKERQLEQEITVRLNQNEPEQVL